VISVPPEGRSRSQLRVRTAPCPSGSASETNNECQIKFELLHLGEEFPSRHIERPGLLYQLARNRNRHLGMTFPHELYPRTSTALVGVVELGFVVECNENPFLSVQFHLSPIPQLELPLTE